jgi:CRP-like cAMP-binding protein
MSAPLALLGAKLSSRVPLDDVDLAALQALPHQLRDLRPSAYIVREGEVPTSCAVLCRGFAYRQKLVEDGARQILAIQLPGDLLDLQHLYLDCADHSVQALTEVTVAVIPSEAMRAIAEARPAVAHALAVDMQVEASIGREWLLNLGRRDARSRIAHLLCEVAVRLEGLDLVPTYGYELPMTQEQLGDATGLTPVHVNRMLRALEEEGLIVRTKRAISFPDWSTLRGVAGFNPNYLHLRPQRPA